MSCGKKNSNNYITSLFAVFSVFYALSLPNYCKSESILVNAENTNQLNGLRGLSGLASIAGINLQNSRQDKSIVIDETLKSRAFVKHLIEFDDILPSLMQQKSMTRHLRELYLTLRCMMLSIKFGLQRRAMIIKRTQNPFIEAMQHIWSMSLLIRISSQI